MCQCPAHCCLISLHPPQPFGAGAGAVLNHEEIELRDSEVKLLGTDQAWHPSQGPLDRGLSDAPRGSKGHGTTPGVRRRGHREKMHRPWLRGWGTWANRVASAAKYQSLH